MADMDTGFRRYDEEFLPPEAPGLAPSRATVRPSAVFGDGMDMVKALAHDAGMIDWSRCADVDRDPERCHGAWCAKGTRIMVQGILDNADEGCSAEEIATEIFELPVDVVRRILAFAHRECATMAGPPVYFSGEDELVQRPVNRFSNYRVSGRRQGG
jgi:uncharacterized protein (DUF433 family)